jgi:hypothetical protein
MPLKSVEGTINSVPDSSGGFVASFAINGLAYTFSGYMGLDVPAFVCGHAKLTYDEEGDLTTRRFFEGNVGKTDINITIENGPTISGKLDNAIDTSTAAAGTGVWRATG